ncbi:MAG: FHA domain-containing protein [Desulfobacterales bacterium]|jgi:pSer/pThr/pTyr-binding forkhead associated (FHA) protein
MPTLTLKLRTKSLGKYPLKKGASLTIGRRETNDIVIEDPAVSGHHAKIDWLEDRFVLIDLQSKNGSFVNEQLITSQWLKHGDVITIGGHSLVFHYQKNERVHEGGTDQFDETAVMNTTAHRRMMIKSNPTKSINVVRFWDQSQRRGTVKDIVPDVPEPPPEAQKEEPVGVLIYLSGGTGQFNLTREITTIGKHPTSDIIVKGLLMDPTAVTIRKKPDGFYLDYLGGMPKPKVNDKTVKKSIILNDLDIIEIGSVRLQFSIESSQNKR